MLSDLFEFKLIFVRELVPFEKWHQEATNVSSYHMNKPEDQLSCKRSPDILAL